MKLLVNKLSTYSAVSLLLVHLVKSILISPARTHGNCWLDNFLRIGSSLCKILQSLVRMLVDSSNYIFFTEIFLSESDTKLSLDFPINILNIFSKSAPFLRTSSVQTAVLYGNSFIPGTILVNRCCTFSNSCLSLT